jgi:hypothetical protein
MRAWWRIGGPRDRNGSAGFRPVAGGHRTPRPPAAHRVRGYAALSVASRLLVVGADEVD